MTDFIFDLQRFDDTIDSQEALVQAIKNANAGDTIILTGDITDGTGLNIDKELIIDFGEYTYSGTGTITITTTGNVTFTTTANADSRGGISGLNISNSGTLTMKNVALESSSVNSEGACTFTDVAFTKSFVGGTGTNNTYEVSTQNTLQAAITAAKAGDTINVTAAISDGGNLTIEKKKDITVDFNGFTYETTGTITTGYNVNSVTLKNGTITGSGSGTLINNRADLLTLDGIITSGGSVLAPSGYITGINTTSIEIAQGQSFDYQPSSGGQKTTYTVTGKDKGLTFLYETTTVDEPSTTTTTVSVKGLEAGNTFTANTTSGDEVNYSVTGVALSATMSQTTKIYIDDKSTVIDKGTFLALSDLDFNTSDKLKDVIKTTGKDEVTLTISEDATSKMKVEGSLIVFNTNNGQRYGMLTKTAENTFKLEKDAAATGSLNYIKINDGLKVEFEADNFKNIPITVSNSNEFTVLDTNNFTVSGENTVSVDTAEKIGLTSGIIITNAEKQSIGTGNYTISGYEDTTPTKNGIYISADDGTVGDIDIGESFTVTDSKGSKTYKRTTFGVVNEADKEVYMSDDPSTVDLDSLASNMRKFIAPDNKVLTIGGDQNNYSAIVLSTTTPLSESDPASVKRYAELVAKNENYTLQTVSNPASLKGDIDIVSVASGKAQIYTSLVKDDVVIQTKDATFIVQDTGNKNFFVVDGSSQNAPTVTNATELTLLTGNITAIANSQQTITLGNDASAAIFKTLGGDIEISTDTNGNYVIKATAGDTFTLGNSTDSHTYAIDASSNGVTFTVNAQGEVTISNWSTVGEQVTVDEITYIVSNVGFIRKDTNSNLNLWTAGKEGGPSINGGSVTAENLLSDDNWKHALATVNASDNANAATLSANTFHSGATEVTLVGGDYNNFFGNVKRNSGTYDLTTLGTSYMGLKDIYLESGTISAGQALTGITLRSGSTTLSIIDDASDGYQVTLSSGGSPAYVSAGETAKLIDGPIKVDSKYTVTALNSYDITGQENSGSITLTADSESEEATISGLNETNNAFFIGPNKYGFNTVVGLTRTDGGNTQYLLGSKNGTVTLKGQVLGSQWGSLLSANALTIDANTATALVVDSTVTPVTLYADYNQSTKTLSQSDGGADWDTKNNTINIKNTDVTFTKAFIDAPIQGLESKSVFLVSNVTTSSNTFTVTDASTGVTVSKDATEVSLQSGLIAPKDNTQSIITKEGTISNAASVKVGVDGSGNAYITDIDKEDTFKVNGVKYTKREVGLLNKDNQLLTDVTVNASVAVSDLNSDTTSGKWKNTTTLDSGVLVIPAGNDKDEWIVLDDGYTKQYGGVTLESGTYTITKADNKDFTVQLDTVSRFESDATFLTNSPTFTVAEISIVSGTLDSAETLPSATIGGANSITQISGYIAVQNGQTIKLGENSTISVTGTGDDVVVSVNDSKGYIAALDANDTFNDTFIVNGTKYTLFSSEIIKRDSDGRLYKDTVATTSGTVSPASLLSDSNWLPVIETDSEGKITLDSATLSASAFIQAKNDPSTIYGQLEKDSSSNTYQLTTTSRYPSDATLSGIELYTNTELNVSMNGSNFNNVPIIAGDTEFVVKSGTDWKVNYTSDDSGNTVSANNQATEITLNKGTLYVTSSQQTITAGETGTSLKGADTDSSVAVSYNTTDKKATVALDEASKAINIAGTGYSLTKTRDGGINVEIDSDGTKVTGITAGDTFQIGSDTYTMTDSNLLVNSSGKLWTGGGVSSKYNIAVSKLTLSSNWSDLIAVTDDKLTISDSNTSGILVDNTSNPTIIYGQITENVLGTCTIGGTTTKKPYSITVNGVEASISSYFDTVPVKLESNATVNYNEAKTVSGAVESVVFGTMTFMPVEGDEFTLDGTTYHMYTAGLTNKDAGTIWKEAAPSYVLPGDDNWLPVLTLDSDGTLNLSGSQKPTEDEYIIVDTAIKTRVANLKYSDSTCEFTKIEGTIGTIQLPADILTVKTDFDSTIETAGVGTYTINGKSYTTSSDTDALTVKTTANSNSTLYDGKVSIKAGDSVTTTNNDNTIKNNIDSKPITATAKDGEWYTIDTFPNGSAFEINGQAYEVLGNSNKYTLIKKNDDGDLIYKDFITSLPFNYSNIVDNNFSAYVKLNNEGILDLTQSTKEGIVVQNDSVTARVADLAYDGGFTLSTRSDCSPTAIAGVSLSSDSALRTFTNKINKADHVIPVTATKAGEYTINEKSFNAEVNATFDTYKDTAILTNGTVTLSATRAYNEVTAVEKDVIEATTGEITVNVDDNDTITVGKLNNGDVFSYNGTNASYLKTSIGLANNDKTKLNTATGLSDDTASIETTNLDMNGTDWKDVEDASKGKLTIDSSTPEDGYVVDLSNPKSATNYGTITKDGETYTYTGNKLASVTIDTKAKVALDKNCAGIDITADGATFQVTASNSFNVDATSTTKSNKPIITGATAITLKSGTIQATEGITTTAGGYEIKMATGSDMTIGVSGSTVTIDNVEIGESFTVGDKTYTMTKAGLTDKSNQIHTNGVDVTNDIATVTLNKLELGRVLVVNSGGVLDLSDKPQAEDNIIVDNSKTTRLATLTYTASTEEYVFNGTDGNKVDSVKLPDGTLTATTDFVSTINTGNGTYTINSKNYKGSGLEIAATDTTSTLTNGTVSLSTDGSVTATVDGELVDISGNGFEATVKDGSFTELTTFNTGDSFTYKTNTYLQTDCGLKRTTTANVDTINEKLTDTTLKFSKLDEEDNFIGFLAPVDGTLNLTGNKDDAEAIVFDNTDSPTVKLGKFTIKDDGMLTLKGEDTAPAQIKTIVIDPSNSFTVDFVTQVEVAAGEVTVNKKTFVGQKKLTLDSDGKTSTLYEGTITLNTTNPSAQATKDTTALKVTAAGNITAVAEEGKFTDVKNLVDGDKFTFSEHTYTKSAVGLLRDDKTICEDLGSSVDIEELLATSTVWQNYIAPTNKAIDLTGASNALVFDNTTLPTKKLGTLTVDSENQVITFESENATDSATAITNLTIAADTELVVDFATDVAAPIGSVIVNDAYYNGTSALTIHSDGTTSTLTEGTITLSSNGTVTTTTSNTTVNATGGSSGGLLMANSSDILTVNVDSDGKINLSDMTVGTSFIVGGNTYKVTTVGVMNSTGKIWTASDYKEGITDAVTELVDDDNWTTVMAVSENLTIDDNTLAVGDKFVLVDNASNPTKRYGVLSKAAEDDYYLATSDIDTDPTSIIVDKTKIEIGDDFADVPINTINGDGSNTKFTVTVESGKTTFIVAAEDYAAEADNVSDVELEEGPFKPKDGQNVDIADGADKDKIQVLLEDGEHTIGGKTFTLAGSQSQAMATVDDNGKLAKISNLVSGATITPKDAGVDGGTCTSTADGTTLNYSDTDGYYFDGLTKDAYNISVDAGGHVTVDAGVAFTKVVSSGRTLDDTATIKTAVDTATIPVTVTNNGTTGLNISDTVDDLAKNFSKQSGVVFNANGVIANDFTAAKGTTFIADNGQTVAVGEDFKVVAGTDNVEVTIGDNAAAVDKMATITAPADFGLTLAAAEYTVNDLTITPSGTLNLTTTADGVIVDLATSEPFIYDEMTFSGTGTAEFAKDKNATLTGGAIVTNAINKELTVVGTVTVDGKTINAAEPTDVFGTAAGLSVGDINLEVFGDDLYTVNIAESSIITGLENIGAADGVTVAGLSTATILTDAAGPFSVDRTFNAGASVTYGIEDSVLTFADDVTTISGDFSKVLTVNDMPYTITGGTATIDTEDGTIDTGAGTFNINGKTYTTNQPTTWTTDNGTVTGADLSADGTLAIRQNETDFDINGDSLTLTNNSRPVTLAVDSQSGVTEARGINGIISGLDDATVYDVARATIDSTPIYVRNDSVDAVVANGSVSQLTGLNSGAVVNSAPTMTVTSAENGSFTFVGDRYNVTDADNSVDFITDENSRVTNIGKLEGSLSGNGVKDVTVNDKDFTTSDGNVTIASDGTDITAIDGLASGDTIGGDLEEATFTMPEGQLTMNSAAYTLAGDENGVTMSDDGKRIAGFAREASLTVGEAGSYTINGTRFNANAGDTFTSNRDGVYKFDPTNPPINDTTPASEILALSDDPVYVNNSSSSVQVLDISDEKTLALIDSPNGNTSVKTGMGNDSVIARHGGNITVDVADGDATIVPTSAKVTLDNYRSDGDAAIKTYEYTNIPGAIKSNDILFGDGVMTLGDAVINFGSTSATSGATFTNIINATNQKQAVGFTHTAGGTADVSEESSAYVLKGNYAESDSDTQKTAGSTLLGGSGNDTLLIGAGDVADAGDGTNQIYVTDPSLRAAAATIVLNAGKNTVYKFSGGHDSIDDRIQVSSLNDVEFGYGSGLTMTSGDAILTFNGLQPSDDLVTVTGANASLNAADPYKIRLTAGNTTYNAEIAQSGKGLGVAAGDTGNLFYGNGNGISFSEFTGNVSVNLNENSGSVGGRSARFYNFDKVAAGAGNSTLIGENGVSNTLMAGTGNGVIRSGSGADLMVGTDGYDNTGRTRFYYTAGYGRDTITNFDFMASSGDTYSDYVEIGAEITGVSLQGANVVIGVEGNDDDYLTLVNAANQHFAIEGGIAKVGTNLAFDGMTDYYVGATTNSSVNLAANMGNTEIWLGGEVGDTRYFGDISVINAANANGENILAGNSLNNMIVGGTGKNSIWGGQGANDDTLVGGSGQNTFFFMANNGNDIVRNAHDGDIVDLSNLDFNKITAADIGDNGVSIALDDGSHFTIEGRAAVDYKLSDGSTYTADHNNKTWNQK